MSEEISFTQEQLDEAIQTAKNDWIEKEFNPVIAERDGLLQYKPVEKSESEIALEAKQQELFNKEINLTLKENGLEQFASIVKVGGSEELQEVVNSLSQIVNDIKVSNGYVPSDHKQDDPYSKFEKEKDTKGMIGSKLANLFK